MGIAAFSCKSCGEQFRTISSQAGRQVRCPHCRDTNEIPTDYFEHGSGVPEYLPGGGQEAISEIARHVAMADAAASRHAPPESPSGLPRKRRYAHLAFARFINGLAVFLYGLGGVVQAYILFTANWGDVTSLPMKLALPAIAVSFVPGCTIFLAGAFLMAAARCVELLSRIEAKNQ